jgi:hypothetical protein
MKKEILKQLIKEEIRKVLKEDLEEKTPPTPNDKTTPIGLGKELRVLGKELPLDHKGISSQESDDIAKILNKLIELSRSGNAASILTQFKSKLKIE